MGFTIEHVMRLETVARTERADGRRIRKRPDVGKMSLRCNVGLLLHTETSQHSRGKRLGKMLLSTTKILTAILFETIEHAKRKFSMFGLLPL